MQEHEIILYQLEDTNVYVNVIFKEETFWMTQRAMAELFDCTADNISLHLKNIYKELYEDLGIEPAKSGDLTKWAKEGVLLLNSTLTVIKDTPNSHSKLGWQPFTDYVIKLLNSKDTPIVFILWGNFARSKKAFITNSKHLVIESAHPSPFSARYGFFGSKPFSKTNDFLIKNGLKPVDWDIKK